MPIMFSFIAYQGEEEVAGGYHKAANISKMAEYLFSEHPLIPAQADKLYVVDYQRKAPGKMFFRIEGADFSGPTIQEIEIAIASGDVADVYRELVECGKIPLSGKLSAFMMHSEIEDYLHREYGRPYGQNIDTTSQWNAYLQRQAKIIAGQKRKAKAKASQPSVRPI